MVILRISPAFGLFRGCCGESETVCTGNGEDIRNAWAIIHDFDIKATLCAMPAYVIFAENGRVILCHQIDLSLTFVDRFGIMRIFSGI